jgi:ribosomal protein S2
MGDIVNLRKFRKQTKKRDEAERAAANRVVHGRTKAEREQVDKNKNKLHRHLDGHRIESGDT